MYSRTWFLWLRSILIAWIVTDVQGEIRCFCNDASCVNKSYMCKSTLSSCFVMLSVEGATTRTIRGCADSLLPEVRVTCLAPEVNSVVPTSGSRLHQLMCCSDDMCNYNLEAADDPSAKRLSVQPSPTLPGQYKEFLRGEVWFKAAVIAVPIAGILILGLLVLLAVRMLRADTTSGSRCRIADISGSQLNLSAKHFNVCGHATDNYGHVSDSQLTDHVCCVRDLASNENSWTCICSHPGVGSRNMSGCRNTNSLTNKLSDQPTALNGRKLHGYTKIQTHCHCRDSVCLTERQSAVRTEASDVEIV